MKPALMIAILFFSLGARAYHPELKLTCYDASQVYEVRIVSDCLNCMGTSTDREVGNTSIQHGDLGLKAYVRNTLDMFQDVLQEDEFLFEKTSKGWVFANLRDKKLLSCDKSPYELEAIEGILERVAGIGGESTGIALRRTTSVPNGGFVEVTGANHEITRILFDSIGKRVFLKGKYKTKIGVERGAYQIFVVHKIEGYMAPRPIPHPRPWPPTI